MEQLLQYLWKHKIFLLKELRTTTGLPVEIIDSGQHHPGTGPLFIQAKVKIGGTLWAGNVEVRQRSSERPGPEHQTERDDNPVILHVAWQIDAEIRRADGQVIPQMQLVCPDWVKHRYDELRKAGTLPRCSGILGRLPRLTVHSWLTALQNERFEQKALKVGERLEICRGNWEDAFFITLARNFGFGLNGDAFEEWAARLPYRAIDRYRDNLQQTESFFFGTAGLLTEEIDDPYYRSLQKEYAYLSHAFELVPVSPARWRFAGVRPGNYPHLRIAQLAWLYHNQRALLSQIVEADNVSQARNILRSRTSEYWESHHLFGKTSPRKSKPTSDATLDLVLINTVVTFLFAYGKHRESDTLCRRAQTFLETLKAENNCIIRLWSTAGIKAFHAADSQALIQLKKVYCDQRRCLHCRFGFEYLKSQEEPL